jgi:hypothetical protein
VSEHRYDYLSQFKWTASPSNQYKRYRGNIKWYACRWIRENGKKIKIYMHREIKKTRKGHVTDHIDNNSLNNQDENLRNCSQSNNMKYAYAGTDRSDEW